MWRWLSRIVLAIGFLGVVVLGVWNGEDVGAQGDGRERLYLPIMEVGDLTLHDYIGLAANCIDPRNCRLPSGLTYFTVRADGSEWQPLAATVLERSAAWSPDGQYFVYARHNPDPDTDPSIQTMLVSLSTRDRYVIMEHPIESFAPAWSPDSRYVALIGTTALYIFDVETNALALYPLPDTIHPTARENIVWSSDSQQVAWASGDLVWQPGDVWVWAGHGTPPQQVYQGDLWGFDPLFWSPDGERLLINYFLDDNGSRRLLESDPLGSPAHVLLEGFTLEGWVDGGTRMVLRDNSTVYLANADGTGLIVFFNETAVQQVFPSPQGDSVAIFGSDIRLYFKSTDDSVAQWVNGCGGGIVWRKDGAQFLCNGLNGTLAIIDLSESTPMIVREATEFYFRGNADFLSPSDHLVSLERSRMVTEPYPHAVYDGSYVFSVRTGIYKAIRSPEGLRYPVIEWRYMP